MVVRVEGNASKVPYMEEEEEEEEGGRETKEKAVQDYTVLGEQT